LTTSEYDQGCSDSHRNGQDFAGIDAEGVECATVPRPKKTEQRLPKAKLRRGEPVTNRAGETIYRVRVWNPTLRVQIEEEVAGFAAAVTRQDELEKQIATGRAIAADIERLTMDEVFAHYIKWYKTKPDGSARPLTSVSNDYDRYTIYVRPTLGNAYIRDLDLPDLHDLLEGLTKKDGEPVAASTRSDVAGTLKRMFRYARLRRYVTVNVAIELQTGWGGKVRRRHIIPSLPTVEAQADLFESIRSGTGDIVRLLAYTGMRWEEAAAVQLHRVDLRHQRIVVAATASEGSGRRDVRDDTKTEAAKRTIVIPDHAMPAVRRLVRRAEQERQRVASLSPSRRTKLRPRPVLLVTGVRGGYYSYATWRRVIANSRDLTTGKVYTAHELRHVCASILIATPGITDVMIANQMGHAKVETVKDIYAHLFALDLDDLLTAMNATVSRLWVAEGVDASLNDAA
jgi:integrase